MVVQQLMHRYLGCSHLGLSAIDRAFHSERYLLACSKVAPTEAKEPQIFSPHPGAAGEGLGGGG